jgi:cystathionine gamma-lyase
MDWNSDDYGFETRAIHAGQAPDPTTGAVVTPVYLTSTYVHSSPGQHQGYEYSRSHNPTRRAYEECVANLEGGRYGFAMASGCIGATTVMHLLAQGDHVVCCDDMYGGTYRLFEHVFRKQGIDFTYIDLTDPAALEGALRPNTRMVWIESPTNPLMKLVDIAAVAAIAHAQGAWLMVDNTFLSPYFQRPLALGADLVLHSTTKYINGHSDLVGGLIVTDDDALGARLAFPVERHGRHPEHVRCVPVPAQPEDACGTDAGPRTQRAGGGPLPRSTSQGRMGRVPGPAVASTA